ncbi:MAG: hypothetical protein Fur0010_22880 [Bdellovibrio sp.]
MIINWNGETSLRHDLNIDSNLKIGLCHGVFDIIHAGHIKHFEEAKNLCDLLIVSLTKDEFVKKGPYRPHFNFENRSVVLSSIRYIDHVIIDPHETSIEILTNLKPHFYFKGKDYATSTDDPTGKINDESSACKNFGGQVIFTKSDLLSSSSVIINERYPHQFKTYLTLKKRDHEFIRKLISKINFESFINNPSDMYQLGFDCSYSLTHDSEESSVWGWIFKFFIADKKVLTQKHLPELEKFLKQWIF